MRGRRQTTFSFDWELGSDSATIKRYGSQVTRKFIEQYTAAVGDGSRAYTVKLVGIEDAGTLLKVRDRLKDHDQVEKVRDRGFNRVTTSANNRGVATHVGELRVTFAGSQLELAEAVQRSLLEGLDRQSQVTDLQPGTLTVRVGHSASAPADPGTGWDPRFERDLLEERLLDFTYDDPVSQRVHNSFLSLYHSEGSPKIGVILNRRISDDAQRDEAAPAAPTPVAAGGMVGSEGVVVNVGGQGDSGATADLRQVEREIRAEQRDAERERKKQVFATQLIEDGVSQRLRRMQLTVVDPTFVRNRILAKARSAGAIFNETELQHLLQEEARDAGLDVVLIGHSFISSDALTDHGTATDDTVAKERKLGFTVRTVSLANGEILGSVSWAETDNGLAEDQLQQLVDTASDYIAANTVAQVWETWAVPKVMTVTVYNARTPRDVMAVMSSLSENLESVQQVDFIKHEAGVEGGMGKFSLRYEGDYDALLRRINSLGPDTPFELDPRGVSRADINLRIRDGG